jgi:hypothetical protein
MSRTRHWSSRPSMHTASSALTSAFGSSGAIDPKYTRCSTALTLEQITGHPETKASHSRSACGYLPLMGRDITRLT